MENPTIQPAPLLYPGLTWRIITRADLAALVELALECQRVDGGLALLNEPGTLRERYFPDEPFIGWAAFAPNGRLAACASVRILHQSDAPRARITGQVRPEWRSQGLGTALMRWSLAQAQALLRAAAVEKGLLQIATEALTAPADHLYRAFGFEPVFEELVMQRDLGLALPERPLPEDVTLTSWQPALAEQFFQAYENAFRDRPGFPGYSAGQWIADTLENECHKPEWSLLARTGDGLPVGFLSASAEAPGGYVVQVGVIPAQRRRGLASALMVEALRRMQVDGKSAVQLAVNLNNPGAIQTYLALGFVSAGRRARYERTSG